MGDFKFNISWNGQQPRKIACPKCNTGSTILNYGIRYLKSGIEHVAVRQCDNKECKHVFQ